MNTKKSKANILLFCFHFEKQFQGTFCNLFCCHQYVFWKILPLSVSRQAQSEAPVSFTADTKKADSEPIAVAVKLEPGLSQHTTPSKTDTTAAFLLQLPNPLQLLTASNSGPTVNSSTSPATKAEREKAALEAREVSLNREVEAPFEEKRPHSIKQLTSGRVGRFVRCASGRTKLILGLHNISPLVLFSFLSSLLNIQAITYWSRWYFFQLGRWNGMCFWSAGDTWLLHYLIIVYPSGFFDITWKKRMFSNSLRY